jgi:hypothetical protein
MAKQAKKVVLSAINSELRLRNSAITIRVLDPDDPQHTGRLRIGRATLKWVPKFKARPRGEKKWEELIDFMMS